MYNTSYTFGVETNLTLQAARERIEELLKSEGFGILTEIDVQATLKKKINKDFRPYLILGACNPNIAYQAFGVELEVGALLPCNVIVYQNDKGGTNIAFMDPEAVLSVMDNSNMTEYAKQVKAKLESVIKQV